MRSHEADTQTDVMDIYKNMVEQAPDTTVSQLVSPVSADLLHGCIIGGKQQVPAQLCTYFQPLTEQSPAVLSRNDPQHRHC